MVFDAAAIAMHAIKFIISNPAIEKSGHTLHGPTWFFLLFYTQNVGHNALSNVFPIKIIK